jgi:hypothetical protein
VSFDLGVYLTVVGAVMLIMANMSKVDKREDLLSLERERQRRLAVEMELAEGEEV